MEPILKGDVPVSRKAAAAASTSGLIVMLGGIGANEEEQPILLDELVVLEPNGPSSLTCTINPPVSGQIPAPRSGATMVELSVGKLFLYGGFNADGKPYNDAYVLDVERMEWTRVYNGHPDLVGTQGKTRSLDEA
jgi:dynein heavy chain